MEIKEIDGKKFVEYKYQMAERKRMIIQISFLIVIIIASGSIIFAVKAILNQGDLIGKDPIIYGMIQRDFISCQCFDSKGVEWYSDGKGFVSRIQAGYPLGGEWNGAG